MFTEKETSLCLTLQNSPVSVQPIPYNSGVAICTSLRITVILQPLIHMHNSCPLQEWPLNMSINICLIGFPNMDLFINRV